MNRFMIRLFIVAALAQAVFAGTINVRDPLDRNVPDDKLTLREAILIANGNRFPSVDEAADVVGSTGAGTADQIAIILPDVMLINLVNYLPVMSDSGDSIFADTNTVISGAALPYLAGQAGLHLTAGNITIAGLTLQGFPVDAVNVASGGNEVHGMILRGNNGTGFRINGIAATGNNLNNCVVDGNTSDGVRIELGANANTLHHLFVYGNLGAGIVIDGVESDSNVIYACNVGIKEATAGFARAGNVLHGIHVRNGAKVNRFGNAGNFNDFSFIANNHSGGILIEGAGTDANILHSMYLGWDATEPTWIGNGSGHGITVSGGCQDNQIGQFGAQATIVIGGHQGNGILVTDPGTDRNNLQRIFIGSPNPQAGDPKPNVGHGIELANGVQDMFIGGPVELSQVEIDHAGGHGLFINGNNPGTPIRDITLGVYHFGDDRINFPNEPSIGQDTIHVEGNVDNVIIGQTGHSNTTNGAAGWGLFLSGPDVRNVQLNHVVCGQRNGQPIPNNLGGIYIGNGANQITFAAPTLEARCWFGGNGDPTNPQSDAPGILIDAHGTAPSTITLQNTHVGTGQFFGLMPNTGAGIAIKDDFGTSPKPVAGLTIGSSDPALRCVIGGNAREGVLLSRVAGVELIGNYIGVAPEGNVAAPNGGDGVRVVGCEKLTIGKAQPQDSGNVISGNLGAGLHVRGASHDLRIHANRIGTSAEAALEIGNALGGVIVAAPGPAPGKSLVIGGRNRIFSGEDASDINEGNVISGNQVAGIDFVAEGGFEIERVKVQGNFIGTDDTGAITLGNQGPGVRVKGVGVKEVKLGELLPPSGPAGLGNVISGNQAEGVLIEESKGAELFGNRIGTDVTGTSPAPNARGVLVTKTTKARIGRYGDGRNVISGNIEAGIVLRDLPGDDDQNAERLAIHGNYIGTTLTGRAPLGNQDGILVNGPLAELGERVTIGGVNENVVSGVAADTLGDGNLVSGNARDGIRVEAPGGQGDPTILGLAIQGNLLGLDETGATALPNQGTGIHVLGGAVIGATIGHADQANLGNVISGNIEDGVLVEQQASHVEIYRNRIGQNAAGTQAVANTRNGVWLRDGATRAIVERNKIYYNELNAVRLSGAATERNKLSFNSIHRNKLEGIRIEDDANGAIKPPDLDRLHKTGRPANIVEGKTIPNGKVQAFIDPTFTEAGYWGQGRDTRENVTITAAADGAFTIDLNQFSGLDGIITATVTDDQDNTSAFTPILTGRVIQTIYSPEQIMVAGKPTVVRFFGDTGLGGQNRRVAGSLTVGSQAASMIDPQGFRMGPYNYFNDKSRDRLRQEGLNSLNFYLDNPAVGSQTISLTLDGDGFERARLDLGNFDFQLTNNIKLLLMPIEAPDTTNTQIHLPDAIRMVQGARYFADVYPVNPRTFMSTLTYHADPVVLDSPPHGFIGQISLLETLDDYRSAVTVRGGGTADYIAGYVNVAVGLSDDALLSGYGNGGYPRTVVLVDRTAFGGQRAAHTGGVLCHEIGHTDPFNFGDTYKDGKHRDINPLPADPTKFDKSGILILEDDLAHSPTLAYTDFFFRKGPIWNNYAGTTGSILGLHDFMSNADDAWTDLNMARVTFQQQGGTIPGMRPAPKRPTQALNSPLYVRGSITTPTLGLTFRPMTRLRGSTVRTEPLIRETTVTVELRDGSGHVLDATTFDLIGDYEQLGFDPVTSESTGAYVSAPRIPFGVMLRDDPAGEKIVVRVGAMELGSFDRSANAPTLSLTNGNGPGTIPDDQITLAWTGNDADPGGAANLTYDVLYTPDDGQSTLLVARDVPSTSGLTLATNNLPGGAQARFIVRARDGWNVTEVMSNPPLVAANKLPVIKIVQPDDLADLIEGQMTRLFAASLDPEDGILQEGHIVWTLNGVPTPIAFGQSTIVALPRGTNVLRATATDTIGNVVFDEITLTVRAQPATASEIVDFVLGKTPMPDGSDINLDGKVDIGDVVGAVELLLLP